jgi:hypothetical protein
MVESTKARLAAKRKQRLAQALKANLKRRKEAPALTTANAKTKHSGNAE